MSQNKYGFPTYDIPNDDGGSATHNAMLSAQLLACRARRALAAASDADEAELDANQLPDVERTLVFSKPPHQRLESQLVEVEVDQIEDLEESNLQNLIDDIAQARYLFN
ncbi:unnamed protein product [Protopolystoma xenopodis]|uniref:Uncharacterized protein n=1 Tax=Protopolystoma xenopodis TaxID=117903 RepID=A0A3S5AKL1_9PLAT|nr:unnamed protein product [Protopolystoma xenopodis]